MMAGDLSLPPPPLPPAVGEELGQAWREMPGDGDGSDDDDGWKCGVHWLNEMTGIPSEISLRKGREGGRGRQGGIEGGKEERREARRKRREARRKGGRKGGREGRGERETGQ